MKTDPADNPYLAALKIIALAGMAVGGLLSLLASVSGLQNGESGSTFLAVGLGVFCLGFVVMFIWLHAAAVTWGENSVVDDPETAAPLSTTEARRAKPSQ